ncbi:MAG: isochorismatase family protein [Actinomycetota bacterium]
MNKPTKALLIVDVQPTFCEGGSLPVQGGNEVAEDIAVLLKSDHGYQHVITTQDWHIQPGQHFAASPDYINTWPEHGLAGSKEADLHPELVDVMHRITHMVKKGMFNAAYSGFEGVDEHERGLNKTLQRNHVTHIDVVGLALDYCVKATAIDSVHHGYETRVLTQFSAAVSPEKMDSTISELEKAGVGIVGR